MTDKEKLEKAKEIIRENYKDANCGIFDCRNIVGDPVGLLYNENGLEIWICYNYSYFEVFGLSDKSFSELEKFYEDLRK